MTKRKRTPRPAPVPELKPATKWSTQPGDAGVPLGHIGGPNQQGEYMMVVSSEYDEAANVTRLGWANLTIGDLA